MKCEITFSLHYYFFLAPLQSSMGTQIIFHLLKLVLPIASPSRGAPSNWPSRAFCKLIILNPEAQQKFSHSTLSATTISGSKRMFSLTATKACENSQEEMAGLFLTVRSSGTGGLET